MPPAIGSNVYIAFCEDFARLFAVSVAEINLFLLAPLFTPTPEK